MHRTRAVCESREVWQCECNNPLKYTKLIIMYKYVKALGVAKRGNSLSGGCFYQRVARGVCSRFFIVVVVVARRQVSCSIKTFV